VLASPEELQNDPHGEGWLLIIRPNNPEQMEELMDSETYSKKISKRFFISCCIKFDILYS